MIKINRNKVIELIENHEWKRLELIAQFEQRQKQTKLNQLPYRAINETEG